MFCITTVLGCSRRRDGTVGLVTVQVALMSEVARARAAVDADVVAADVAEAWLRFLWTLSLEKGNRVRCHCRVKDGRCLEAML
jgi:hypothetical protein